MIRLRIVRGLYRAALEFPARVGGWLMQPPDFHACRFANETDEGDE